MTLTQMRNATPWAEWRALAFLTLGWSPGQFWAATPHDLWAALQGRALLRAGLTTQALGDLRNTIRKLEQGTER